MGPRRLKAHRYGPNTRWLGTPAGARASKTSCSTARYLRRRLLATSVDRANTHYGPHQDGKPKWPPRSADRDAGKAATSPSGAICEAVTLKHHETLQGAAARSDPVTSDPTRGVRKGVANPLQDLMRLSGPHRVGHEDGGGVSSTAASTPPHLPDA